ETLHRGATVAAHQLWLVRLGELEEIARVAATQIVRLASHAQPLPGVLTHRLQQAITRSPQTYLRLDERLLRERLQHWERACHIKTRATADSLHGVEIESTTKDRQPTEERDFRR